MSSEIFKSKHLAINPPVFITSFVLLVAFLLYGVLATESAGELFAATLEFVTTQFGWFYVVSTATFIVFCLWLLTSKYAGIRLGDDEDRPEFSTITWFSMLFSAGMGIGLVFYGVAEPMMHYASPPGLEPSSIESARQALPLTFFHWGIHAWAVYALMGLGIAYFSFRWKLPLTLRSCFYPILGESIHGLPGHLIDILAVFGTLFGLAASLGVGSMQVSAGLNHLFDTPHTTSTQLILILVITCAATISLLTGVKKGIRRLSELNVILAGCLMVFVFLTGPTLFLVESFIQNLGGYMTEMVTRTFRVGGLEETEAAWAKSWTIFYWGWWIAWAPFVGMFIARISRGRTIRELILGVLLVPSLVTFIWFTVFGNTALYLELVENAGISAAVSSDVSTAIYVMLEKLPLGGFTALLAAGVVTVFFVTSSDSASLVVDMLTSGGHPNPPMWQRIFWASSEGACAAVLLYVGGEAALKGIQAAVVSIGLPFCVVLVVLMFSLVRGLRQEAKGLPVGGNAVKDPVTEKETPAPQLAMPANVERILVPVDHSAPSKHALLWAQQLAKPFEATVDILHVGVRPSSYLPIDEWIWGEDSDDHNVDDAIEQAAQKALNDFVGELPEDVRSKLSSSRLELGVPYEVILKVAKDDNYDLIVMGTHGLRKHPSPTLGSVAERVVRRADCPVFTVR